MSSERAFLGMSHSPLIGLNPAPADLEQARSEAVQQARSLVQAFDPELVILVAPDHYNGFFNELMPPFCIGSAATAVGDYESAAGPLNVSQEAALALVSRLMATGFDLALSRQMQVDHGFAQVLELLWDGLDRTPPVVPIFLNAVAQPGIPHVARCMALGQAIGEFLEGTDQRTLLIGSGGLSHEPPVPTLDHPDAAVRDRITYRRPQTPADRAARTERVMAAGMALASGTSGMKPLNPAWDERWMDLLERGDWDGFKAISEDEITREAGLSAHESKTWLVARAALSKHVRLRTSLRFYRAIPEYIAGYGAMFIEDEEHSGDLHS